MGIFPGMPLTTRPSITKHRFHTHQNMTMFFTSAREYNFVSVELLTGSSATSLERLLCLLMYNERIQSAKIKLDSNSLPEFPSEMVYFSVPNFFGFMQCSYKSYCKTLNCSVGGKC